jgi:hypothetical protein
VDLFGISGDNLVLGASGDGKYTAADSEAEELRGLLAMGNYFSAPGGRALLERTLTQEDDQEAVRTSITCARRIDRNAQSHYQEDSTNETIF